jgi:DNA topoisomerase-1
VVLATKGHLKDLPPKDYGIDFKNDFFPSYQWLKGKKVLFSSIKKSAKIASDIYIASDPDREGEMIAEHISEELGSIRAKKYRIRLNEISKKSLENAIASPGSIDPQLVDSQVCRRLIDRIFGFEISPVLWRDLKISGLSAGRVQSAVLKWICERELEIRNFVSEAYISLKAVIVYENRKIELSYVLKNEEKKLDKRAASEILKKYGVTESDMIPRDLLFTLEKIEEKDYKYNPPNAFTTASLQETAAKVLGFSSSQTMRIAQSLYEGKRIGGEMVGLITYMRTDSTKVSDIKRQKAISYLSKKRPELKLGLAKSVKSKLHAQEAHEAILPTDPGLAPEHLRTYLSKDELSLYELIWNRLFTSLLEPETGVERSYTFESKEERWITKQKQGKSLGYKQLNDTRVLPKDELFGLKIGASVLCNEFITEDKKTTPKERYTEGQIVAKMETTGIGRPSTYSQIIDTLKKRKYILEVKKKLGATALGERVNDYLVSGFFDLIGEKFTKEMEIALDELAGGKGDRLSILNSFYKRVKQLKEKDVIVSKKNSDSVKQDSRMKAPGAKRQATSNSICPVCGKGQIRSKFSKNGKTIYFCSQYPQCDFVSYEPIQA